jgi:ABC-type phosphate transport system substrate-binding protein
LKQKLVSLLFALAFAQYAPARATSVDLVGGGGGAALRSFLRWMLTDGQGFAEGLGYARLPEELSTKELAIVGRL